MKLLVLDNYDSFTFNLVHLAEKVSDAEVEVHLNDRISVADVERFDKILLSPGPGLPSESGILMDVIKAYAGRKPILGVCLGLQAIAEVFGAKLMNMQRVYHGVASPVRITADDYLFNGLPSVFNAGRYHSWVVDAAGFPSDMAVTAIDENGFVMAAKHERFDVRGVQFHPESILSEYGAQLMSNWINRCN